jgi:hypothetical protein
MANLEIKKYNMVVERENTTVIDIFGISPLKIEPNHIIYLTVKDGYDDVQDDSSAILKEDYLGKDVVYGDGHNVRLPLSAEDLAVEAGKYVYDIKWRESDSKIDPQATLVKGKFQVVDTSTLRGA